MPGFATGPLNVKKPFSILSFRPNAVYVRTRRHADVADRAQRHVRRAHRGDRAREAEIRARAAKAEFLAQIDLDIGARRERPDRLAGRDDLLVTALALHGAVGPHDHDVVAEARRGLLRQVEERVIDVELAVDRHAALHAAVRDARAARQRQADGPATRTAPACPR